MDTDDKSETTPKDKITSDTELGDDKQNNIDKPTSKKQWYLRLDKRTAAILAIILALTVTAGAFFAIGRTNDSAVKVSDSEAPNVIEIAQTEEVAEENPAPLAKIFRVAGKTIIDPDGNIFTPMGINAAAPIKTSGGWEYIQSYYNENISGKLKDVQAWNWNIIRLTVHCAPSVLSQGVTQTEVIRAVNEVIKEYTPHKIVVMPDCHDLTGENPLATDAIMDEIDSFWTLFAPQHADNPYVWFNYLNEPQTFEQPDSIWYPLAKRGYDHIRKLAPNNIIVLDLPNQANRIEASYSVEGKAFLTTKCNVLYGWHAYGIVPPGEGLQTDSFAKSLTDHRAVFEKLSTTNTPILIGEMGHDWNETRQETNWNFNAERNGARSVIALNDEFKYGGMYWHGTGNSNRDMIYGLKKQ